MKVKIGFIGSGSRASNYAVQLKKLEQAQMEYAAICDIN